MKGKEALDLYFAAAQQGQLSSWYYVGKAFQEVNYSTNLLNYGLGTIYTEGLGVPQDIKKGVEYLQKCKNYAPAQEALLKFKKTLFGKWVRR